MLVYIGIAAFAAYREKKKQERYAAELFYERQKQLEEYKQKEKERLREKKRRERKEQRKRLWRTITRKKQVIGVSSEQCLEMHYKKVVAILKDREFYNISISEREDLPYESVSQEGTVGQIVINGRDSFNASVQFPFNATISIVYHSLKTALPPLSSKKAKRMDIEDVMRRFVSAGFQNVHRQEIPDLIKGWLVKENSVEKITINGNSEYSKKDRFRLDAIIEISFHSFKKN